MPKIQEIPGLALCLRCAVPITKEHGLIWGTCMTCSRRSQQTDYADVFSKAALIKALRFRQQMREIEGTWQREQADA